MHIPISAFLIALVLVVAVLRLVAAKLKPRDGALDKPWPLEPKRQVLSERERALYQLIQSLPNHIVLGQVQVLQVINFQRGRRTHAILNRTSQLSLDFESRYEYRRGR
jgi:hypothetical protein